EFGLTLLNTKHLLYLSKFCRFFASSAYPCDSLSGVSFCSSFIGFYPLFSIFALGVLRILSLSRFQY
ncbi:hypothetical protein GAQ70_19595, partial [Bacteroides uniformis]